MRSYQKAPTSERDILWLLGLRRSNYRSMSREVPCVSVGKVNPGFLNKFTLTCCAE